MKIFYLDTSSSYLSTGIVENDHIIDQVFIKLDKDLSSFTLPKIDEMFRKNNIQPNEIDQIIVVNGPGSFTGIRIGVTIAKIYACFLEKQIKTVSSLEAMARSVPEDQDYDYVLPMIDARRGYVYGAIYDKDGKELKKESYIQKEALEHDSLLENKKVIVITNDSIDTKYPQVPYDLNLLRVVEGSYDKPFISPHAIDANYLKKTEAEEKCQNSTN